MIVSIHVPKTAGTSFRYRLEDAFGPRLLTDYGDWLEIQTPDAAARRQARAVSMRARRDDLLRDYDVIHGHFSADKYAELFPRIDIVAFFREPCQHAVFGYQNIVRQPDIDHPVARLATERRMTLIDSIAAFPNPQSLYVGRMALEDLAVVGLAEQYGRSVALFEAVLGCKLPPETKRWNVNPDRSGDTYSIDPDVRRAIDIHRAGDVELYRRAAERFARLAARYNV